MNFRKRYLRTALFFAYFMVVHFPVMEAGAANYSIDVTPSLRLEPGWESTSISGSSKVDSSYFRVRPSLALGWNTSGAGVLLTGAVERTWYLQYSEQAEENPYVWDFRLGLSGGDAVRITSALSVRPSVYFINSTNSARRTDLLPSGDTIVPPVTISTYGITRSQDFGGGLAFNYLATANTSVGFSGNYGERRFSGNDNAGLTDSTTVGGGLSVSYLFTPRSSTGFYIAGSYNTFVDAPDANTVSAGIPVSHQFSPNIRIDGALGITFARQKATTGVPERNESSPTGNINFSYASGTFTTGLFLTAGYTGSSGYAEMTYQNTTGIHLRDQFAENWWWNLGGTYQISRSAFASSATKTQNAIGGGGVDYIPLRWLTVVLSAGFDRQKSEGEFALPAERYFAFLGINIGKTYNVH